MLQCSLQLSMGQGSRPKATTVGKHWVSLLDPVVKLICSSYSMKKSCMVELCLIETDFNLLFVYFTL